MLLFASSNPIGAHYGPVTLCEIYLALMAVYSMYIIAEFPGNHLVISAVYATAIAIPGICRCIHQRQCLTIMALTGDSCGTPRIMQYLAVP